MYTVDKVAPHSTQNKPKQNTPVTAREKSCMAKLHHVRNDFFFLRTDRTDFSNLSFPMSVSFYHACLIPMGAPERSLALLIYFPASTSLRFTMCIQLVHH